MLGLRSRPTPELERDADDQLLEEGLTPRLSRTHDG
jgi:hypothetical protein